MQRQMRARRAHHIIMRMLIACACVQLASNGDSKADAVYRLSCPRYFESTMVEVGRFFTIYCTALLLIGDYRAECRVVPEVGEGEVLVRVLSVGICAKCYAVLLG